MEEFNLSDKIIEQYFLDSKIIQPDISKKGPHFEHKRKKAIYEEDVKEFIRLLKEEVHIKAFNTKLEENQSPFRYLIEQEDVWDIIDKLAGDKLI